MGAQDISELALNLEKAGKDSDMNMINEYLPELLKRYRSLKDPLDRLLIDFE